MTQEELFWEELGGYSSRITNTISRLSARSFIGVTNLRTKKTWWSDRTAEIFSMPERVDQYGKEQVGPKVHPDDREYYRLAFRERMLGKNLDEPVEYRLDMGDGKYRTFSATCDIIRDEENEPFIFVVVIDDNGIEGKIDAVTGLHSSATFTNRVREIAALGENVTIMKIGLNKFSNTNIMYGTEYGDAVLKKVSELLVRIIGSKDVIYRLAGAKFACILEESDRNHVVELYEKMQHAFSEEIFIDGKKVPLGISGGAIHTTGYRWDSKGIRSRLTYALNHSKHKHHGELVIFNDDICHDGKDNLRLLGEIHQSAIQGFDGFFLSYQPIADPKSGRIIGMEALLRWKKEPYGMVPPGVFIEWLEEDPCIFELGNWIIRRAVQDANRIRKYDKDFFVNVNVSAAQLDRKEFRASVLEILREEEMPVNCFCMELTERCREMDMNYLRAEIDFFRKQGIKVALDDFGTGNSSLSAALELTFDELKIDMSFVREIESQPIKQQMIKSIVDFAKNVGREVCIEGVENQSVYDFLKKYDATLMQGYYYSKPLPFEEFHGFYEQRRMTGGQGIC